MGEEIFEIGETGALEDSRGYCLVKKNMRRGQKSRAGSKDKIKRGKKPDTEAHRSRLEKLGASKCGKKHRFAGIAMTEDS